MNITTAFATILALATGATAFKVRAWTSEDCEGEPAGEVNVRDNTCMDGALKTQDIRSIELISKGWTGQRACAYANKACHLGFHDDCWWADGGGFPMHKCKIFERGINAFSSFSDPGIMSSDEEFSP